MWMTLSVGRILQLKTTGQAIGKHSETQFPSLSFLHCRTQDYYLAERAWPMPLLPERRMSPQYRL